MVWNVIIGRTRLKDYARFVIYRNYGVLGIFLEVYVPSLWDVFLITMARAIIAKITGPPIIGNFLPSQENGTAMHTGMPA